MAARVRAATCPKEASTTRVPGGGARQRYLNRALDPATLAPITDFGAAVWTDYDGDAPYGDYVVSGLNSAVDWRSYEPGIGEVGPWSGSGDANTQYHHADHLGTLRLRTFPNGVADATRVFSAFGERLAGPAEPDRYGYVGAHGYQGHEEFPFLHVGARYYDPGSGRFLQRDPIGIEDQTNVYAYVANSPLVYVDPEGMWIGAAFKFGGRWLWRGGKWVWGKANDAGAWAWGKARDGFRWFWHNVRIERHQIPGYRNYGAICHLNIGKKHIILSPRVWWDKIKALF